jgi:putative glutathione S-transferase
VLFDRWAGTGLYPDELREDIDYINDRVYTDVNNGVYRAGFAGSQAAYDRAFNGVFATLAWLDDRLADNRYLAGDELTIADWRLFPTLVRFDVVYNLHFRCNGRRLIDHASLWPYARDLFQQPGVAATVEWDQIKEHYYTTHPELNPKRIIPKGPLGIDWNEPSGR